MNHISKLARVSKSARMGIGNTFGRNVYIGENVVIGNNNKFFPNTRICSNVEIGDNNVFLENNTIGDQAVLSTKMFTKKEYNGVTIGNDNLFYFENRVDSGSCGRTLIGSHNKFLSGVHVGHDTLIGDHVYLYPKVLISGFSTLLDHCGIGTLSGVQQRTVIGPYSFIGMVTAATSHKFPFYIYLGNRPVRFNLKRCPETISGYKDSLDLLCASYTKMSRDDYYDAIQQYPDDIRAPLEQFFDRVRPNTA